MTSAMASAMTSAQTSSLPSASYGRSEPRNGGDELFGPLPTSAGAVGTPIFEAVASAWFRDDERGPAHDDFDSAGDREWRDAAARATRTDAPSTTASGLPRRSPGDRLVPPPRTSRQAAPPDERVPEAGPRPAGDLPAGPAAGPSPGRRRARPTAPEAWSADGW